ANVPSSPTVTTGAKAARVRFQPMCIPPSNRMTISPTVTTRCTVITDTRPSAATRSDATAATSRKIAGAGTGIRALIRLDSTASVTPMPTTPIIRPKNGTSVTADQAMRRPSSVVGQPEQLGQAAVEHAAGEVAGRHAGHATARGPLPHQPGVPARRQARPVAGRVVRDLQPVPAERRAALHAAGDG